MKTLLETSFFASYIQILYHKPFVKKFNNNNKKILTKINFNNFIQIIKDSKNSIQQALNQLSRKYYKLFFPNFIHSDYIPRVGKLLFCKLIL